MSAFPPQRSVSSIPVSQDIALKYLSAYLEAAKSSPHLLPNARLEPSGPTAGSSTSSITIHNLQRVEAGLKGEWLAFTLELGEQNVPLAEGMDDGTNKGQENEEGEGWMDLDEYQREQSIEGGNNEGDLETGGVDSDLEVDNQDDEDDLVNLAHMEKAGADTKPKHQTTAKISKKPLDKNARKAEKKARQKLERKQKQVLQAAS